MSQALNILNQIIDKGGLMGHTAKYYKHDEIKAHEFILECFEQCNNSAAVSLWGNDLIKEIICYSNAHVKIYNLT